MSHTMSLVQSVLCGRGVQGELRVPDYVPCEQMLLGYDVVNLKGVAASFDHKDTRLLFSYSDRQRKMCSRLQSRKSCNIHSKSLQK
jgi:hypothetical protein